ncbi:MAG TPA: glycerophosphodiester phosphodiesterase [Mycobacteriales bacterium]|nr:glycerophosphodiester phosphodiesterase [Mycobacteriales bacterium]
MPAGRAGPESDPGRADVLLIAHRAPPLAAGCVALGECGVTVFELDVQAAGAEVVVSHFRPVLPVLPWLRRDRWALRWGSVGAGAERLSAAVDRLPAGTEVLLDLKDDGARGAVLVELILRAGLDPGRCYASSKQWSVLPPLRRAGFRTWRSVAGPRGLSRVLAAAPTGDDGVTVRHTLLDDRTIERLRRHTGQVVAWTVNDPARAARLAATGVAGITSDNPEVFRRLGPP